MRATSRLWLVSALLIAAGAVLQGAAVTAFWQPCAGSMLTGSVFNGYRLEPEFTEECLATMDGGQLFPLPQPGEGWTQVGSLGAAAALLFALAWLVVLPTLRVPRVIAAVAAAPSLLGIALVVNAVLRSLDRGVDDPVGNGLLIWVELSALIVLVVVGAAGVPPRLLVRCALVLLVASGPGYVHQIAEYIAMTTLSAANWDVPPGSGYLGVLVALVAALTIALLWWSDRRALHAQVGAVESRAAL